LADILTVFDVGVNRRACAVDVYGGDPLENVTMLDARAFNAISTAKIDHGKNQRTLVDRVELVNQRLVADERSERLVEARIAFGQVFALATVCRGMQDSRIS